MDSPLRVQPIINTGDAGSYPGSYKSDESKIFSPPVSPLPSCINNGLIGEHPGFVDGWIQRLDAAALDRLDATVRAEVLKHYSSPSSAWSSLPLEEVRQGCIDALESLSQNPIARRYADLCEPVMETSCKASDGYTIPLRVIKPAKSWAWAPQAPVIIFFHGGGHVIGGPCSIFDYACQRLAVVSRCIVVSVDYRLAPENPFPQGVNDAWEATQFISEHAVAWGGDHSKLCVAGDSAGGNLAAVIAQKASRAKIGDDYGGGDHGVDWGISTPNIILQVLLFPVVDWSSFHRQSYKECGAATPACDASHMEWYQRRYLPNPADRRDVSASPIYAVSLAEVAPAIVITSEFDVLRSDAEAYATRLREANKLIRYTSYNGYQHDFLLRFHYEACDKAWDHLGQDIADNLGWSAPPYKM